MTKVEASSVPSERCDITCRGKSQAARCQSLGVCLESDGGHAVLKTNQRRQNPSETVTSSDDIRVRIELCNFLVQLKRS